MAAVPVNTTIQTQIANLYIAILGRNPEPTGFGFWCDTLANNGGTAAALNAITLAFSNSPEFVATYGGRTTSSAVSLMYNNVLDRAPDSGGLTYWTNIANAYIAQGYTIAQAYALTGNAIITTAAANTGTADQTLIQGKEATAIATGTSETYTLTTNPDTATAVTFLAPMAYTPGGNDLVNTLQNEDVLTGNLNAAVTLGTVTSLTGDLGNYNDNGYHIIAPSMTNVQTVNIAFTNTSASMELDFQDITGTTTANITRISNNLRDSFTNLSSEVANLGIANTSEQAKATITYLNNELASASNAVTLTLNNASLSSVEALDDTGSNAALVITATAARGSDLQQQIETYNIATAGSVGSTIATLKTGVSDYNDLVVGQRPVTFNITTGATASLAIGTLRWLGNRVETNSANDFQAPDLHLVGTNGQGFVDISQITAINVTGGSDVTLANVGTWNSLTLDSVVSSVNASTLTGNLTADISNAADSGTSSFVGGLGDDRFYVGYGSTGGVASVVAEVSGGTAGIDTLTVQSNNGATVNLASGSSDVDVLNLVQGVATGGEGATWNIDLLDGGFTGVTFDNQATSVMSNSLTNFYAAQTVLSIRSTGFNDNGDPVTTQQGDVNITLQQQAGLDGGTLNLVLGGSDDRYLSNAFSFNNYTAAVSLIDNGTAGANALDSLNLVVNTAGAGGTSALALTVVNSDFETSTTLSSEQAATNTVNIGFQQTGTSSDYSAAGTNGLNSTTYNGSAYLGQQNVTFGSVNTGAATNESFNITTGSANGNTVDLSFMGTSAARTTQGYALSSYLLNTVVNLGTGTGNELILSATLADPRVVITPDATYDGYFANWSNVDTLTINNRNGINTATVGVDAYAQINNAGLNTINFNDVSGTFVNGFRFTNDVTINVDAVGVGGNQQIAKTTTINSLSEGDIVLNVVESSALTLDGSVGNSVAFTSTGAALGNNVTLNYTGLTNAATVYNATTLAVTAGSLDTVTWGGDLGIDFPAAPSGSISVTTADTWTASGETTTYSFAGVTNTLGTTAIGNITFTAAAETNTTGLTIIGSSDGGTSVGTAFSVVNNTITGSAGADTITTAGYQDVLVGGLGADTITYTGAASSFTTTNNTVSITGDLTTAGGSADTITIYNMAFGETATVNAGAGNDIVSLNLESDTYIFANVATVAISTAATVSQTVLNVGSDTITNYITASDVFQLSTTVFGTAIGVDTAAFAAAHYQQVTSSSALVGALTTGGIVVIQSGTSAAASIYYVDQTVAAGVSSVNELVQAGHATLIGQVNNVTGAFGAGEFAVIA